MSFNSFDEALDDEVSAPADPQQVKPAASFEDALDQEAAMPTGPGKPGMAAAPRTPPPADSFDRALDAAAAGQPVPAGRRTLKGSYGPAAPPALNRAAEGGDLTADELATIARAPATVGQLGAPTVTPAPVPKPDLFEPPELNPITGKPMPTAAEAAERTAHPWRAGLHDTAEYYGTVNPVTRGAVQVGKGLTEFGALALHGGHVVNPTVYGAHAPAAPGAATPGQAADTQQVIEQLAAAGSDVLEGGLDMLTPVMVAAGVAAPLETAGVLVTAHLAGKGGQAGTAAAGGGPQAQRFVGNLASIIAGAAAAGAAKSIGSSAAADPQVAARRAAAATLGVDPAADPATIKAAYRAAAQANHPDVGGDVETMADINLAYRWLVDHPDDGHTTTWGDWVKQQGDWLRSKFSSGGADAGAVPGEEAPPAAPQPAPMRTTPADQRLLAPAHVDEAGRDLGGYAGPERRQTDAGPPPDVEERRLPAEQQVREDLKNNPDLIRQADEMRRRADDARGEVPKTFEDHLEQEVAATQEQPPIAEPPAVEQEGVSPKAAAEPVEIPVDDVEKSAGERKPDAIPPARVSETETPQTDEPTNILGVKYQTEEELRAALPPITAPNVTLDDIPRELANRAHAGTSWTPESRGAMEQREYVTHMQNVWNEVERRATTDQGKALAPAAFNTYRTEYLRRNRELLASRGRLISVNVAGPSKFPVRRQEKADRAYSTKLKAFVDWQKTAYRRLLQTVDPTAPVAISSDRPTAVQDLEAKIAKARQLQETMKAANKIVRSKLADEEKVARLKDELKLSDRVAHQLLKPDYMGRIGFPNFELTNNAANIRRMEARTQQIGQERAKPASGRVPFEGGFLEEDGADNRIRLYFDDKPPAALRAKLKSHGFKWAPSVGAWQRLKNDAARIAVRSLLNVDLFKRGTSDEAPSPGTGNVDTHPVAERAETAGGGSGSPGRSADDAGTRGAEDSLDEQLLDKLDERADETLTRLIAKAHAGGFAGDDAALRRALEDRLELTKELNAELDTLGRSPEAFLRFVAGAGGLSEAEELGRLRRGEGAGGVGYTGEIRWLKEFQTNYGSTLHPKHAFGTVRGVRGVFASAESRRGRSMDGLLEVFREQHPLGRFTWIQTIDDLISEFQRAATADPRVDAARQLEEALAKQPEWWNQAVRPMEESDAVEPEGGDVSFDPEALEAGSEPRRLPGETEHPDVSTFPPGGLVDITWKGKDYIAVLQHRNDPHKEQWSIEKVDDQGRPKGGTIFHEGWRWVSEHRVDLTGKPDVVQPRIDDLQAKRAGMPQDLADDINLIGDEKAWRAAVTTPGARVTGVMSASASPNRVSEPFTGTVIEGAKDPVNGLGKDGMALVEHRMGYGAVAQRWYRALELEPAGKADVLDTGEEQPRLPVAGAVRDTEVATPEFEAPFSLSGEAAERGEAQGGLFERGFSAEELKSAERRIKNEIRRREDQAPLLQAGEALPPVPDAEAYAADTRRRGEDFAQRMAANRAKNIDATAAYKDQLRGLGVTDTQLQEWDAYVAKTLPQDPVYAADFFGGKLRAMLKEAEKAAALPDATGDEAAAILQQLSAATQQSAPQFELPKGAMLHAVKTRLNRGDKVELENGWTLKRREAMADNRIVLRGLKPGDEARVLAAIHSSRIPEDAVYVIVAEPSLEPLLEKFPAKVPDDAEPSASMPIGARRRAAAPVGRKAQLEAMATDEAMGVEFPEDEPSHFPNGEDAVVCTNCARRIIELNGGRGDIYGWPEGDNPTAIVANRSHDGAGHDFAVIDGRYLVDAWAKNVEMSTKRAVFDLDDPKDRAEVRRLYGDPTTWVKAARPLDNSDLGFKPGAPPQLQTKGTTVKASVVPGAEEFLTRDVIPTLEEAAGKVAAQAAGFRTWLAPDTLGAAESIALAMRANRAAFAHDIARLQRDLQPFAVALDKLPFGTPADQPSAGTRLALAMAIDEDRVDELPESLREVARRFAAVDKAWVREVQKRGGFRQGYVQHYYPRNFKKPGAVRRFIEARLFAKRPFKGTQRWRKQRARDEKTGRPFTLRQLLKAGFTLAEENPVRAFLQHWDDAHKWTTWHDVIRKEGPVMGYSKYFPSGTALPEGWQNYPDSVGLVYGKPSVTIEEGRDKGFMDALNRFAAGLGIRTERTLKKPGRGGPRGAWGLAFPGQDRVWTKFGGTEGVLVHELGHALDYRYGLGQKLGFALGEERIEEKNFNERSRALREMHELAKLRWEGEAVDAGYKRYVQERNELVANLVHGFVYIPERTRDVAPNAYWALYNLAKDTPTLNGLIELQGKRSLKLGVEQTEVPTLPQIAGRYAGPREAVRLMENHLAPGLRGKPGFDVIRMFGNGIVQVKLGLSGFHLVGTALNSIISRSTLATLHASRGDLAAAAKAAAPLALGPLEPFYNIVRTWKDYNAFLKTDAHAMMFADVTDQMIQGGWRSGWDTFWQGEQWQKWLTAWRNAAAEYSAGNVIGGTARGAGAILRTIPALIEAQAYPVMKEWVPRLKFAAYLDLYRLEAADLGAVPQLVEVRRAAQKAMESVENRFGQLVYENLFWPAWTKDLALALFQAPGWGLGDVRELLGAIPAQLRQLGLAPAPASGKFEPVMRTRHTGYDTNPKTGEQIPRYETARAPWLTHKFAYLINLLAWSALFGAMYQLFHTGLLPGEQVDGTTDPEMIGLDLYFPRRTREAGAWNDRTSLPTYIKDLYHFGTHPLETVRGKIHPIWTMVAELLKDEDYWGTEIYDKEDPWLAKVQDMLDYVAKQLVPISFQSAARLKTQGATPAQRVESFFGFTPAPREVTRTPLEKYLHDVAPPVHRTKAEAEAAAARRDIRQAVKASPIEGKAAAREAFESQTLTPRQLLATMKGARKSGIQYGFASLPLQQAIHAYEVANREERAELYKALQVKAVNAGFVPDKKRLQQALALPRAKPSAIPSAR